MLKIAVITQNQDESWRFSEALNSDVSVEYFRSGLELALEKGRKDYLPDIAFLNPFSTIYFGLLDLEPYLAKFNIPVYMWVQRDDSKIFPDQYTLPLDFSAVELKAFFLNIGITIKVNDFDSLRLVYSS